ncbi:type III pantothenate kinase [Collinsella sp. AGMB00827]|uniref:Type III pantothenate kinase n=1 Tax=Collinsella ureilytica TaxID=2869515 RepID=A0ABS7MK36_9ACTN|nr:type III pantothenate kinase [Collinsella urealyticum]MBY4797729.1 type III pantothenate kinase [Collinsella urealyticum]
MLLAVDMGNTQTALGLFDGKQLVQSWRMPTDRSLTKDDIHVRLLGFFSLYNLDIQVIEAIAFAGVVPQLLREWKAVAAQMGLEFMQVKPGCSPAIHIDAPHPEEVGADRIANAVAAATLYGTPCIVVDFGTATNVDVIDERGFYIGGAIAPGIGVSLDALVARAAKLSSVSLEAPNHALGRNTTEALQSGTVIGAAAMAEGLVARIAKEMLLMDKTDESNEAAQKIQVIATGGMADLVASCTDLFDTVDRLLTLEGICEIWAQAHR